MPRKYTGISDGLATGERKGLVEFVRLLEKYSDKGLWNNGTWANRPKRGKESMSVHATGRAVDMSYRKMTNKGKPNGRKIATEWLERITTPTIAEALGLEMIIDYWVAPFGRGWKCDRGSWEAYKKETVHGAPNGDWLHLELSPKTADSPEAIRKAFALMFPENPPKEI